MSALPTALLVIGGATYAALAGLWLVHRRAPNGVRGEDSDVAGFVYALIGVVYGIALAFVIFAVWEQFSEANEAVTTEAAQVVAIYRDATEFEPPALRTEARDALRGYIAGVTENEWRTHVGGGAHTAPDRLNAVYEVWHRARPDDPEGQDRHAAAMERLHTLEEQRHRRHLSVESTLPGIFWPILIVGAIMTVAFTYLFRMQRLRTQAVVTAVVAILVSGALFLILSLNRPFTGIEQVSQEPFDHALVQFDAIDMRAP